MDVTQDLRVATGMRIVAAYTVTRMCVCEMYGMPKRDEILKKIFWCSLLVVMYDTIELINEIINW